MSTFLTAVTWGLGAAIGVAFVVLLIVALRELVHLPATIARSRRERELDRERQFQRHYQRERAAELLVRNGEVRNVVAELAKLRDQPNQRGTGHVRERLLHKLQGLVDDEEILKVLRDRVLYHRSH